EHCSAFGFAVALLAVRNVAVDLVLRDVQVGEDIGEGNAVSLASTVTARSGTQVIGKTETAQQQSVQAWLCITNIVVGQPFLGNQVGDAHNFALRLVQATGNAQFLLADRDLNRDGVDMVNCDRGEAGIATEAELDQLQESGLANPGRARQDYEVGGEAVLDLTFRGIEDQGVKPKPDGHRITCRCGRSIKSANRS